MFLHYIAISLLWGVKYGFKLVQCFNIVKMTQVLGIYREGKGGINSSIQVFQYITVVNDDHPFCFNHKLLLTEVQISHQVKVTKYQWNKTPRMWEPKGGGMWIFVPKKLIQCGQWEFQHWLKLFVWWQTRFNWPKETLICECYSIFDRLSTKLLTFGHIINIFREGGKKMSLLVGFYYYLLVFSFNHHQGFQFGLTCKLLTSHLGILHIFWWRETCHSLKAFIWNLITN